MVLWHPESPPREEDRGPWPVDFPSNVRLNREIEATGVARAVRQGWVDAHPDDHRRPGLGKDSMRIVHTNVATPIKVLVAVCAPLLSAVAAQGATVNVRDLLVIYTSQSASGAQGTIEFNLRFGSFDGPVTSYDAFSAQLMINRVVRGAPAAFTLDTAATGNTSIVPEYWLPSSGSTDPLASTQAGEFRFRDRISLSAAPRRWRKSKGGVPARNPHR